MRYLQPPHKEEVRMNNSNTSNNNTLDQKSQQKKEKVKLRELLKLLINESKNKDEILKGLSLYSENGYFTYEPYKEFVCHLKSYIENHPEDVKISLPEIHKSTDILTINKKIINSIFNLPPTETKQSYIAETEIETGEEAIHIGDGLYRQKNRYYKIKEDKEGSFKNIKLSNFILEIENIYIDINDCQNYQISLTNTFNKKTKPFFIEATAFSKISDFKDFCVSRGDFTFFGSSNDLLIIYSFELSNIKKTASLINIKSTLGYLKDEKAWLLGDVLVKDGTLYKADNEGIIKLDDGSGYELNRDFNFYSGVTPNISNEDIDIDKVFESFKNIIGNDENHYGLLGLGFAGASMYSDIIFKEFRQFPLLFCKGKTQSGKTSYLNFLMSIFGFDTEGDSFSETTQNYVMKSLGGLSNIPYWLDEYDGKGKVKDSYLRGVYNRSQAGKGTKVGTQSFSVNTSLILSGETIPYSEGVLNRCVFIPFEHKEKRTEKNKEAFKFLNSHKSKLAKIFLRTISERTNKKEEELLNKIDLYKKTFLDECQDEKLSLMYAICMAGLEILGYKNNNFESWILENILLAKKDIDEQDSCVQFFEDVISQIARGKLEDEFFSINQNSNEIRLYFKACHDSVKREKPEYYRDSTTREYLKGSHYFLTEKNVKLEKKQHKCLTFSFNEFPSSLKYYFEKNESLCQDENFSNLVT